MGCGCGKRVKTKLAAQEKTADQPPAPKSTGPALWTGTTKPA